MKVCIVGASSFIARALAKTETGKTWTYLNREAFTCLDWIDSADLIINCAYDWRIVKEGYQKEYDLDLQLATEIAKRNLPTRYIMLSSRTVYGYSAEGLPFKEGQSCVPAVPYGQAKLKTETLLAEILREQLCILRLSNVCGGDANSVKATFFSMALSRLRDENRIVLDISPFVCRDFLPVTILAEWMEAIVANWQSGLFNVAAGISVPVGKVAQALIEGYGKGELHINNLREFDAFAMDTAATRSAFGLPVLQAEPLYAFCRQTGKQWFEVTGK